MIDEQLSAEFGGGPPAQADLNANPSPNTSAPATPNTASQGQGTNNQRGSRESGGIVRPRRAFVLVTNGRRLGARPPSQRSSSQTSTSATAPSFRTIQTVQSRPPSVQETQST
ncbi:unnamed protein product [Gongylonema pulchrum]|uniref:Uncharacterized protein n=1 Tax=Gongylonema pulchrum TaxID=637853 RepID=A0A183DB69_9BILA|nr:unnamed protein product [Gongylonema pulchrum]